MWAFAVHCPSHSACGIQRYESRQALLSVACSLGKSPHAYPHVGDQNQLHASQTQTIPVRFWVGSKFSVFSVGKPGYEGTAMAENTKLDCIVVLCQRLRQRTRNYAILTFSATEIFRCGQMLMRRRPLFDTFAVVLDSGGHYTPIDPWQGTQYDVKFALSAEMRGKE